MWITRGEKKQTNVEYPENVRLLNLTTQSYLRMKIGKAQSSEIDFLASVNLSRNSWLRTVPINKKKNKFANKSVDIGNEKKANSLSVFFDQNVFEVMR